MIGSGGAYNSDVGIRRVEAATPISGRRDECRHGACGHGHGHGHEGMTTQHGVIRAAQAIGACKATMEVARTTIGHMLLQLVPLPRRVAALPRCRSAQAPRSPLATACTTETGHQAGGPAWRAAGGRREAS
jgi:hypothetical protein